MEEDDEDYREFLIDEPELKDMAYLFLLIPWKYTNGILIGKEYAPLKDLLEMNGYDLKTTIPLFIQMANVWVNNKKEEK